MTRAALLASTFALVLGFASCGAGGRTGEEAGMADAVNESKLLEEVVREFAHICTNVASHWVVDREDVYPQPCVYIVTHVAEMRALGWGVDFDTVTAVSGVSALFGYQPDTFMPKYAHAHIDPDRRIAEATGFGYEWVEFDGPEEAWKLIRETIDSGRPLKGWCPENVIFAGYRDAEKPEDRKIYALADGPDYHSGWITWAEFEEWRTGWNQRQFGRHTERVPTLPERGIALRVMRELVDWSTELPEKVREEFPEAALGLEGIRRYAEDCANLDAFEDWAMCHPINPQWTVRNSTAIYLNRLAEAGVFPNDVSKHISEAAAEYEATYAAWRECYRHLGHGCPEGAGKSREHREAGAEAVRQALEHEKAGIEELRNALALAEE